jgi:triacylglycerol esterase/lipase EstA (alpha/beta hydrolase family)
VSLISKPNTLWKTGNKGNVILIPGFNENYIFMDTIASALYKEGYAIHVLPQLNCRGKLEQEAAKVSEYILNNELKTVILLGHSNGGLIAKVCLDNYPGITNPIKRIITISTAWKGNVLGYINLFNLNEIRTDSPLIYKIFSNKNNLNKITNIYAKIDNHVIPNSNLLLPGATNILIDIVGHTRVLESPNTRDDINNALV